MSRTPWKGMDLPQRIASLALALLALMALVALLSGCGTHDHTASASHPTAATESAGASTNAAPSGTIQLSDLPAEAQRTVQLIDAGGPFPYSRDGVVFGNYEHDLPQKPRGWYHEYTVKTPGASNRGTRRIIQGKDGTLYYTGDHYQTFQQVQR